MEKVEFDFEAFEEVVSESDVTLVTDIVGLHKQAVIFLRQTRECAPEGLQDNISIKHSR
jgi:hypothetical protein